MSDDYEFMRLKGPKEAYELEQVLANVRAQLAASQTLASEALARVHELEGIERPDVTITDLHAKIERLTLDNRSLRSASEGFDKRAILPCPATHVDAWVAVYDLAHAGCDPDVTSTVVTQGREEFAYGRLGRAAVVVAVRVPRTVAQEVIDVRGRS
jgi:hypothetical protein